MKNRLHGLLLALCLVLGLVACAKAPTWQEQYDLGVRYLSEGNYEEAIIAFTAAIEIDPKQAEAYIGRANTYIAIGVNDHYVAALEDFFAVLDMDDQNLDAYRGIAETYILQGNVNQAKEFLKQAYSIVADKAKIDALVSDLFQKPKEGYPKEERRDYNGDYYPGTYEITEFDQYGNQVKRTWYNANGTIKFVWLHEYDTFSNCVKTTAYSDNDAGTGELHLYWIDENNVTTYYESNGNLWHIRTANDEGKELTDIYYDSEGKMDLIWEYEYDMDGTLLKRTTRFDSFDAPIHSATEYDRNGSERRTTYFESDGMTIRYVD